ncbi:MAG: nucleotidyl transferase AbiEii/AbiGii toxin family protein, partial [Burkholderiales bacterium]|nr:nucleotidyl transferase AbiEii/AbiGii toxin family protein [Burkholderiales bacterium]
QSPHADRFLLKGALLFTLWYDMPHRATRDADLLGFGASDLESVAQVFRDIAAVAVADGIVFDPASVAVDEIRKEAGYSGVRVVIAGEIAKARCKTQIDVGFGDAVTPGPVDATYPVLLDDLPAPRLRAYPTYTVVAEKLHAIALLGMANSRLKDYFDLSVLLERETLDVDLLAQAIKATFERRGMSVPAALPVGLTDEFAHDPSRQALWQAFLKKNELAPQPLSTLVEGLRAALEPVLNRAVR